MALSIDALREALPRGTDINVVLEALRQLSSEAEDPIRAGLFPRMTAYSWYWSPSCNLRTSLALCGLLNCPPDPLLMFHKALLMWVLWSNRDQWSSLLPPLGAPAQHSLHMYPTVTWLQETSLCLGLGMHLRAGSASPVQLLDSLFAREFVCSFLAPPPVFVAFCHTEPEMQAVLGLRVMLARPGLGIVELQPPPLPCLSSEGSKWPFSVHVAARTSSTAVLALWIRLGTNNHVLGLPFPASAANTTVCTSLYFYDLRNGELFNSLSLRESKCFRLGAHDCHEASQRLAFVLQCTVNPKHSGIAIIYVGRDARQSVAVLHVPTASVWSVLWSISGRSLYLFGDSRTHSLDRLDLATGALTREVLPISGPALVCPNWKPSDDLAEAAAQTVKWHEARQRAEHMGDASEMGPLTLEQTKLLRRCVAQKMCPHVTSTADGRYWFMKEQCDDGHVWMLCLCIRGGGSVRPGARASSTSSSPLPSPGRRSNRSSGKALPK